MPHFRFGLMSKGRGPAAGRLAMTASPDAALQSFWIQARIHHGKQAVIDADGSDTIFTDSFHLAVGAGGASRARATCATRARRSGPG
jgi:hypothetical protein